MELRTAVFEAISSRNVVRNYRYSLRNSPEERRSHLLRGESQKSRKHRVIRNNRREKKYIALKRMSENV